MNLSDKELALLADLLKVLNKHGAGAFKSLTESLRAPDFGESLASVVEQISLVDRSSRRQKSKLSAAERRARFRRSLVEFRASLPEKGQAVLALYDALENRITRPSLKTLKAFLDDNDLPGATASSRDTVVRQFITSCKELPAEEVERYLTAFGEQGEKDGGVLQQWGDMILGDD